MGRKGGDDFGSGYSGKCAEDVIKSYLVGVSESGLRFLSDHFWSWEIVTSVGYGSSFKEFTMYLLIFFSLSNRVILLSLLLYMDQSPPKANQLINTLIA